MNIIHKVITTVQSNDQHASVTEILRNCLFTSSFISSIGSFIVYLFLLSLKDCPKYQLHSYKVVCILISTFDPILGLLVTVNEYGLLLRPGTCLRRLVTYFDFSFILRKI